MASIWQKSALIFTPLNIFSTTMTSILDRKFPPYKTKQNKTIPVVEFHHFFLCESFLSSVCVLLFPPFQCGFRFAQCAFWTNCGLDFKTMSKQGPLDFLLRYVLATFLNAFHLIINHLQLLLSWKMIVVFKIFLTDKSIFFQCASNFKI